jgi:(R,R)-butanediol dehydrogenase/meso-butanediol dehydrogenase/diacetyl reductase
VVRASGELDVAHVPDPEPGPDRLVLRVRACGICGTDLHLLHHHVLPAGSVMGHEFSGEVMAAGAGFRAGERACALPVLSCGRCERCRSGLGAFCEARQPVGLGGAPGAFAEYVAVAPHETVRLPPGVDDEHGALVEPLAVALHAVRAARLRRGERCLVLGAGPIGLAAVLWARHFGAARIVVAEPIAARRELAGRVGATAVLDPAHEDPATTLARRVPEGPDVVIEAAGGSGLIRQALSAVRFRGRVVVAGVCLATDEIEPLAALRKEASVHFVMAYEKDDFQYGIDMIDRGRIDPSPLVTGHVDLAGVADAFARLAGPERRGKVLVCPDRAEPGA